MPRRLVITARSPLAFPPRKPGTQFTPSVPYVPGGVLWGALGAQRGETPTARFSHALPAHPADRWVRPLPATALTCKHHDGFRGKGHGVFDTLVDRTCAELLQPALLTYNPGCPVCGGRAEDFGGFYTEQSPPAESEGTEQAGTRYARRDVRLRLLTRVAIDRQRGTASETQLYSPIVISESNFFKGEAQAYQPTTFLGHVWGADDMEAEALRGVQAIGGRTSSGLGQVTVTVGAEEATEGVAVRLAAFNECFRARWVLFAGHLNPQHDPLWSPDGWTLFTVGLGSEALLWEVGWQPTTLFSAAQLRAQTGLEATLVQAQAASAIVGGWNVRWDRPKPTHLAARTGSLFLFRTRAPLEEVVQALGRLEAEGIGQRRAEGFGTVRVCDEFHAAATGRAL